MKLTKYQTALSLLVTSTYCLGYAFIHLYYTQFAIDIAYYSSIDDLILTSFNLLILIAWAIFIVQICTKLVSSFFKQDYSILLLIILLIALPLFNVKNALWYLLIFMSVMINLLHHVWFKVELPKTTKQKILLITFIGALVLSIGSAAYVAHRSKSGEMTPFSKDTAFLYEGNSFSTADNECLIFIGETTENLFLYDKTNKETLMFNKSKLEHLKFSEKFY